MKKIKKQKLARNHMIFTLFGGLILSMMNVHVIVGGQDVTLSGFHAKVLNDQHDHGQHFGMLREYYAGHYIDPKHLKNVGSGSHKLTVNDFKHNAWNYYLASLA